MWKEAVVVLFEVILSIGQEGLRKERKSVSGASLPERLQNCEKRLLAASCLSVSIEHTDSHWTDFHEI